ncbi:MmgE/PrpD family protein [Campylobacter sp. MIT 99-7217]|uniref:MmgE/PrpD family protein n=1 Tax=Campylobacter sp. MIT 99-7217 TaxID=535091 RepID=UPI00115A202A|nr:MmgE/PrpD family protein [Campylobacter sp. MIT 99-7217]TQR34424.1 MmgE/PrpD family protein [Campylobacter sp. MIT 99-7217]
MTYSEVLAEFITNLDYEDIPKNVVGRAKELMLDSFGTALAAHDQTSVLNAIKALSSLPNSAGNVQIWGQDESLRADLAAMCNGIAAHALDFDDTHTEAILHASAILTPLCLSYGFSVNQNGKDILKAFIVGWEVGARVGIASKGSFHKKGFHTTAIAGSFAATAAASVLLKLDKEQTINALGFAGSFASGVNEFLSNGSNSKVLHIANAIKNAIYIAHFAKNSMFAPRSIFEGRDNVFRAFGIEELCDKSKLTQGLNEIWQVLQVSIKPYPSCHFAHGLIDCALELRKEGLKADDIKSIHCFVDEVPSSFICDPINAKYTPKTAYEAKFSMPFLMALAFFDGQVSLKSYENLNRAEILEFAKKISYEKRASSGFPKYFPGHLEAILTNGEKLKKDVFINKGNFDNPLSFEELELKFLNNAKLCIDEASAKKLSEKILSLETQKSFI